MNYYYKGCSSWGWYYPYHYAPRITGGSAHYNFIARSVRLTRLVCVDFVGVGDMTFDFALGKPFKPFQQLMGVLPAASSEHIPIAYRVSRRAISSIRSTMKAHPQTFTRRILCTTLARPSWTSTQKTLRKI